MQVALACMNPPGLACLFLESGGFWDAYSDGVRQGGAFTMKQVTWAFRNAKVRGLAKGEGSVRAACRVGAVRPSCGSDGVGSERGPLT